MTSFDPVFVDPAQGLLSLLPGKGRKALQARMQERQEFSNNPLNALGSALGVIDSPGKLTANDLFPIPQGPTPGGKPIGPTPLEENATNVVNNTFNLDTAPESEDMFAQFGNNILGGLLGAGDTEETSGPGLKGIAKMLMKLLI